MRPHTESGIDEMAGLAPGPTAGSFLGYRTDGSAPARGTGASAAAGFGLGLAFGLGAAVAEGVDRSAGALGAGALVRERLGFDRVIDEVREVVEGIEVDGVADSLDVPVRALACGCAPPQAAV